MRQFHEDKANLTFSSQVRIRCPYCFQIFKAFKKEFEEAQPDFQCSVCREQFWINAKDTDPVILGKPKDMQKEKKPPLSGLGVSTKVCPRCVEEVPIEDEECPHCGVVFIKIIEGVESSFKLRGLWAKVVQNWHNEKSHDEFLRACHKQNELVYGISCYGRILKEDKNNNKAKEMINRMEALTWFFEEEISLPRPTLQENIRKTVNWMKSHTFDALMLTIVLCFLTYIFL